MLALGPILPTKGNQLKDSNNQLVKFAGVNWFGLETGTFAPHGLWARGYKEMIDQMKAQGLTPSACHIPILYLVASRRR